MNSNKSFFDLHSLAASSRSDLTFAFNLAIGFHVVIFLCIIFLPELLKPSPKFTDIYSVKLVNIADYMPEEIPAPLPQESKIEKPSPEIKDIQIKPIQIKKVVPKPKPKAVPVPQKKAVSIKPLKRKKIKKVRKIPPPDPTEIEKKLKKARELELKAEKEAQIAAQQVENIRKQLLKSPKATPSRGSRSNINSLLENQYDAKIFSRLQQFWSLPNHKEWDPNLTAIVLITIRSDGTVTNQYFEKRSGDRLFDQFVASTLQKAGKMPPIPAALKKQIYKVGLRFSPESIH